MTSDSTGGDFPGDARHPALRYLYQYWRLKAQGGRVPARRDLDPADMKPFLKYVIMFDVERHGGVYRFRHRLVGTHIVDLFAQDLTGRYVDQVSSAGHYAEVYPRLAGVVDTRAPAYGVYYAPTPRREFAKYEHLTLPLVSEDNQVDVLIGVRCGLRPGGT
jgi:hypothetical protein